MRILIVDDDEPLAHMLGDLLQRLEPTIEAKAVATASAARRIVESEAAPFDVFLVDQRLDGSDVDGTTLMQELRAASPTSDAIVITAYDDPESGLRAFEAGAYRYLGKPFDTRELVFILKVLERERAVRVERNWLQVLTEIANELQAAAAVQEVANATVHGALRFGFRRARLRLLTETGQEAHGDPELIGVSQAGSPQIMGFEGLRSSLAHLLYEQRTIEAGVPQFFKSRELGPGGADEFYAAQGIRPPAGEWVKIPLLSGEHSIGTLTLDNDSRPSTFSAHQRSQLELVLGLFGKQAAAALDRTRLHEQSIQRAEEIAILSEIGQQITTQAAQGDLNKLLDTVRQQVGRLMDTRNFMVVLLDEDSNYLDFRRKYEEDTRQFRYWRRHPAGLCGEVISKNKPLLLPRGGEEYRNLHNIPLLGKQSKSWLGVPIRIGDRAVGAIVVQDYKTTGAYSERHERLLLKVAEQVSGAISMAYQLERKAEQERQSATPVEQSKVLPRLIEESEDNFWHAVLAAATHRDGHSFNRAVLFWFSETGTRMQGRMAIGHFYHKDARKDWEKDREADHTLAQYLDKPHLARLKPTPLERAVASWTLQTGGQDSPCYQVWTRGRRLTLPSSSLSGILPDGLLNPPDLPDGSQPFDCALLPVKSENQVFGLLLVDNAFDGEPLRPGDLDRLEQLLELAVQVWRRHADPDPIQRLGESYEELLALNREITAQAASRPLKESLKVLCQRAREITRADCVVIYPFRPSRGSYDLELVSYDGLQKPEEFEGKTKDRPRQDGVTFAISQSGTLVAPDVSRSGLLFAGRPLAEHDFLGREKIMSFIGVPMRKAATGEPLGVIYIDYRSPRRFSEQDIAQAEHIAAIGATTISYAREKERETRTATEAGERRQRRDMQLLANIQTLALASDSDIEKIVRAILHNAAELYDGKVKVTLAILDWKTLGQERRQIRTDYHLSPTGRLLKRSSDIDHGPIGQSLKQSEIYLDKNTLAISIRLNQQAIGALLLQKPHKKQHFTEIEKDIAERLVTVAALAMENVRTRAYLQTVSETVGAVSDRKNLEDTLEAVVQAARKVAPDIDCVTLWYEDPETGDLVAGPQWGVRNERHRREVAETKRLVREVMQRLEPIFASAIEEGSCLDGEFTRDEDIASTAAFPLRFGQGSHAFGALFLNYRSVHEFTPMERTLFPIFANAAATAIHSAQTIVLAERRRRRLETALKMATEAGATLEMSEVIRGVLTTLRDEFKRGAAAETAPYIMLYDERDRVLEMPQVARDFYQPDGREYQDRTRLPVDGQGITCRTARRALATGRTVVDNVEDVLADFDYVEVISRTRSELCAGLVSEERLLGALVIKSSRVAAFDSDDEKLFEVAAQQVAIALDRVDRAAQAKRRVSVDGAMAWAADIAHDINSEVGYIRNRAYWLREREENLSSQGIGWVSDIDDRAKQLVDSVRDARFRRNEPGTFSLQEMLCEKTSSWRVSRAANVDIIIEGIDPCIVCVDREQLWRAIRHLLRNAREAMEEADSVTQQITLRLSTIDPNQVELQIEDTGPGISDEALRRIFREPYSTKGNEGRGFGLLLAQWLIESMGGSIHVYPSAPERGALFAIRLPIAHQEVQEEHHVHNKAA